MQDNKLFLYGANVARFLLLGCIIISLLQNYVFDGTLYLLGIPFQQFYDHAHVRIIPYLWVAVFLIPVIKRILKVEGKFYFSECIIAWLVFIDSFSHINNTYSMSITLPGIQTLWFDKIMHFASGLVLFLSVVPIVRASLARFTKGVSLTSASYWMTIGGISIFFVSWEIVELVVDQGFGTWLITGRFDTNEDLFWGYFGILLGIGAVELRRFIQTWGKLRNSGSPFYAARR